MQGHDEPEGGEGILDSTICQRININLRTRPSALQKRLPEPWQVAEAEDGPHKGMNLRVIFNDILLNRDMIQPDAAAQDLSTVFVIPGQDARTGERRFFNLRIFHANRNALPGKYMTSRVAEVSHRQVLEAPGEQTAEVNDTFEFESSDDRVSLSLRYARGHPVRPRPVVILVSSVMDPTVERYYRQDFLEDLVKSVPEGVDHLLEYSLKVDGPDLGEIFSPDPELISITVNPWYVRDVFGSSGHV